MIEGIHELPALMRQQMPEQACELYIAAYNRVQGKLQAAMGPGIGQDVIRQAHEAAMLKVGQEFGIDASGDWHRESIAWHMERIGSAADNEAARVVNSKREHEK